MVGMSYVAFDASGFIGMSFGQNQAYTTAWNTFTRIQLYDSNVSTLRSGGAANLGYYQYPTQDELLRFKQGRQLHLQSLPYLSTLWKPVEKI
jgi:hypothetical protein